MGKWNLTTLIVEPCRRSGGWVVVLAPPCDGVVLANLPLEVER